MADLLHADYDRLERAITQGKRISVFRRGTEFLVIPIALESVLGREVIRARHPSTGDSLSLFIDEIEGFEII